MGNSKTHSAEAVAEFRQDSHIKLYLGSQLVDICSFFPESSLDLS